MTDEQIEAKKYKNRLYSARYYRDNKEKCKASVRRWQQAHPDKMEEYRIMALRSDPERATLYRQRMERRKATRELEREKGKQQRTLNARIARNLSSAMDAILTGRSKSGKWLRLLGCSPEAFRAHLERQFTDGMTWATRGRFGWHLDHVKPLSAFDLTDPAQLAAACHYTNVQPMWWRDNMRKGPKLTLDNRLATC